MLDFLSLHCSYLALPYLALYFTLNVRILGEVQPAELIDRGEKSDFFKSPKKISKNDVSSVQENSKNVANVLTEWEIEFVIFLCTIFPEVVGTYLQREICSIVEGSNNRKYQYFHDFRASGGREHHPNAPTGSCMTLGVPLVPENRFPIDCWRHSV